MTHQNKNNLNDSQATPKKVIVSWSSGKDSALSLIRLQADPKIQVVGLFTTFVEQSIPFQSVPVDLVKAQAEALNLPLIMQALPEVFPPNNVYQSLVVNALKRSEIEFGLQFDGIAFGDMFHNGIADYRKSYIEPAGWECLFPLLGEAPKKLAEEIIQCGIKTFISTVDTEFLSVDFLGREYDHQLLADLPKTIDCCGENGEFHTVVYNAKNFIRPLIINKVSLSKERTQEKGRFQSISLSLN